ncbi:MAG: HEAT repeat domain-containing protein [bacterium]
MLEQTNIWDLQNLNYATKKQIIKSLGEQKDKDACYSLIEFLYDDHKPIQELAMSTLTSIDTKEVVECTLLLLHENDARVRTMAMEIIKEVAYDRISSLVPFLADPDEPMRVAIADLLGLLGNPCAVESLIESLKDTSPHVRSSALASLGRLADERAVGAIENLLKSEEESWVIFSCIKSLEKISGRESIRILLDLLKEKDEFILAATIESLGEIGTTETISHMLDAISHPTEGIIDERMNAAFLSILQREKATNPSRLAARMEGKIRSDLISFFKARIRSNASIWTRSRAIELLGELRAHESLDALASIIQDGHPMLQVAVAHALGTIGGDEAKKLLLQLSISLNTAIQTAAQESLGKLDRSHSEK